MHDHTHSHVRRNVCDMFHARTGKRRKCLRVNLFFYNTVQGACDADQRKRDFNIVMKMDPNWEQTWNSLWRRESHCWRDICTGVGQKACGRERRRFWWDQKWALLAAMLYAIFAVRQTLHPAHILPTVEHGGGSIMQGKCGEQSATFCKRNDLGLYFYFPAICGCVHTKLFKPVIYVICGLIHWATHTHPSCTMYYYEIKG